jgi:hypothetical protein
VPAAAANDQKAQDVLRKVMRDMDHHDKVLTNPPAVRPPTFNEIEQQYLAGKITARQFQKYLQEFRMNAPVPTAPATPEQHARALQMLREATGSAGPAANTPSGPVEEKAVENNPALNELETKMEELLKLKEAREKAKPEEPAPQGNTKRDKLDALLRQLVNGKISEAEYKEQREKILAGPD